MTASDPPHGATPPERPLSSAAVPDALAEADVSNPTPQRDALGPTPGADASGPKPEALVSAFPPEAVVSHSTPMDRYGFPAPLWRALADNPPPGLSRIRLAQPAARAVADVGVRAVLLVVLPVVIVTGLAVLHRLRAAVRAGHPGDVGWLKLPTFDWPTSPSGCTG